MISKIKYATSYKNVPLKARTNSHRCCLSSHLPCAHVFLSCTSMHGMLIKRVMRNVQAQVYNNDIIWKPVNDTASQTNSTWDGTLIQSQTNHSISVEAIRGQHSSVWPLSRVLLLKGLFRWPRGQTMNHLKTTWN